MKTLAFPFLGANTALLRPVQGCRKAHEEPTPKMAWALWFDNLELG